MEGGVWWKEPLISVGGGKRQMKGRGKGNGLIYDKIKFVLSVFYTQVSQCAEYCEGLSV